MCIPDGGNRPCAGRQNTWVALLEYVRLKNASNKYSFESVCQWCRVEGIARLMRERIPETALILMGILPRHKMNRHGPLDWPNLYTEVARLSLYS